MNQITQTYRKRSNLLATGQTTVYAAGDNGTYKTGLAKAYTIYTTGQYSGTTNITLNAKTDAHSNNCVEDNNTGLMWSRYASASVGATSNGLLPWTTNVNGEGIFTYEAAANAAGLAGYSDWRVPNSFELSTLADMTMTNGAPNSTAFPSFSTSQRPWSSTTRTANTTFALCPLIDGGTSNLKTSTQLLMLVRG